MLDNKLIKEFASIVNEPKEDTEKEAYVYGTVRVQNGSTFVQLDGNPETVLTPVEVLSDAVNGERVMVLIKDHTATLMGNATDPASAKTATKYITPVSIEQTEQGIKVHPENDLKNRTEITPEGMDVYQNNAKKAHFGSYVTLGNRKTTAIGDASVVIGTNCDATKKNALAEGFETKANCEYSHAEGYRTVVDRYFNNHEGAHVEGYMTVGNNKYETVVGSLNVDRLLDSETNPSEVNDHTLSTNSPLFEVGAGEYNPGEGRYHRKTVFYVGEEGDAYVHGIVKSDLTQINLPEAMIVGGFVTSGSTTIQFCIPLPTTLVNKKIVDVSFGVLVRALRSNNTGIYTLNGNASNGYLNLSYADNNPTTGMSKTGYTISSKLRVYMNCWIRNGYMLYVTVSIDSVNSETLAYDCINNLPISAIINNLSIIVE